MLGRLRPWTSLRSPSWGTWVPRCPGPAPAPAVVLVRAWLLLGIRRRLQPLLCAGSLDSRTGLIDCQHVRGCLDPTGSCHLCSYCGLAGLRTASCLRAASSHGRLLPRQRSPDLARPHCSSPASAKDRLWGWMRARPAWSRASCSACSLCPARLLVGRPSPSRRVVRRWRRCAAVGPARWCRWRCCAAPTPSTRPAQWLLRLLPPPRLRSP